MDMPAIVISDMTSLPQAIQVIEGLLTIIGPLPTRIEALEAENTRLRDHLHLDSSQRSLPPSSDTGRGLRATKSLRPPSGRKPGGHPDHPGATGKPVERPDQLVVHAVSPCPECGQEVSTVPVLRVETRHVFELPPMTFEVTEHQAEGKRGPQCAREMHGIFPADVRPPVQSGARIKGLFVYRNHGQGLPSERTTALGEELVGQPVSQGTLLTATQACAVPFAETEGHVQQALRQAPVIPVEETGLDETGRRIWLQSASPPELTDAFPHDTRGQAARPAAAVLPEFQGVAVHDHGEASQPFEQCAHAFCHAHHLRERPRAIDQEQAAWAEEMTTLLLAITAHVHQAKATGHVALTPDRIVQCQTPSREIVAQA